MKMRMSIASKADRIWHDLASVGRTPRRAEGLASSPRFDRAGFEPRRGRDLGLDFVRIQTLGSRRSSINADRTERLKSGAEARLEITVILGAPRFSPYQPWATHHSLT
jgi:hypothetical protein